MNNSIAEYQNLNLATRIVLGVVGAVMLIIFYVAAGNGTTIGSAVYLALFSILLITMAIIGWSPIVLAGYHRRLPSIKGSGFGRITGSGGVPAV